MAYFDIPEAKMSDLDGRVATLEVAPGVDPTDVNAAIAALNDAVQLLDARLDAIAAAAAD